jgi:hypothetical protein
MARFEHRYAALVLGDDDGVYARFTPTERMVDGREVRFGVLETTDAKQVARLREIVKSGNDPDLVEVKGTKAEESK